MTRAEFTAWGKPLDLFRLLNASSVSCSAERRISNGVTDKIIASKKTFESVSVAFFVT